MAEHSKPSRTKEKPSTKQIKQSITPAEAAELLTSALGYCDEAKLIIEGYNEGRDLILVVRGLQYVDGKVIVTPIGVTGGVTMVSP